MFSVELVAKALKTDDPDYPEMPEEAPRIGICALTGEETMTFSRKCVLGSSFTTGALMRAPDSDRIGIFTYIAMRYKWARMGSWICDGKEFKRLDRVGVRNAVFGALPETAWSGYATTSYKKHGVLFAPVNTGSRRIWLFEMLLVDCSDMVTVHLWWSKLNDALRAGFGRSILESLNCPAFVMQKAGMSKWIEFEAWATDKKNSPLYSFLCYLLPSQEELKGEVA